MNLLTREQLEGRETRDLAPWGFHVADSRGREHAGQADPWRTAFQRDRDRIVHARAFRRLAHKTQVFLADSSDLVRSRLTHSMEVAAVARDAARRLGLNEDLCECTALAHDLGHPPFGHRGEHMLNELLADHGGFEHNRQALRVVDELEQRYAQHPGLNLSYEVRESIVKHGFSRSKIVPAAFHPAEAPLIEAQLVDYIDSIAYDCHDTDDAVRAGLLRMEDLSECRLLDGALREAAQYLPSKTSGKLLLDHALRHLLGSLLADVVDESQRRLAAAKITNLADVRAVKTPLVGHSPSLATAKAELESWLRSRVYRHWRVNRTFHKAQAVLGDLYRFYTDNPDSLPDDAQERSEQIGVPRTVGDYLAGMTDRYAMDEHVRLFDAASRAW